MFGLDVGIHGSPYTRAAHQDCACEQAALRSQKRTAFDLSLSP